MDNVMFIGWNNPRQGREAMAGELFGSCLAYFGAQKEAGNIESFEPILLSSHGGDMNGFFLVKGDAEKLDGMGKTDEFMKIAMQLGYALQGFGIIRGWHGDNLMQLMGKWTEMVSQG
jgi:hypothetical protein